MARLLHEREARYRALAEATGGLVWATAADGQIGDVGAWAAFTGQSPEQARGRRWLDAVHPDDRAQLEAVWSAALADRRPFAVYLRVRRADGLHRLLQCRGVPVYAGGPGEAGELGPEVREWVLVGIDVTLQTQRERMLAEHAHAEEAARERLNELLEGLLDGFLALDAAGRITYVNGAVEQVVRLGRDALLGRSVWEAFPDAAGFPFERAYEQVVAERRPILFEAYYPPLELWLETRMYPVSGGVAVYFADVTERRKAEKERARQLEEERAARAEAATGQARFSSLMESNVVGIVVTDGERIVEANDAFLGMLGYTRADLATGGLRWWDITPEEVRERARHAMTSRLARADAEPLRVASLEQEYLRRDGSRVPVLLSVVEVEREPFSALCFLMDLSERKRLERELAERANALEAVFEATPDGLAFFDGQARMLRMNAAYRQLLGYEEESRAQPVPPDERTADHGPRDAAGEARVFVRAPLTRALRGETLMGKGAMDAHYRAPDGSERDVSTSAAPLRDEEGRVRGAVLVVRDVTERRALERQRTDILRTVAHDLANPVSAMKLYIQMQERRRAKGLPLTAPDPEALEWLGHILTRMERLLEDLRTAASIETGALRLEIARTELGALCRREVDIQREITGREVELDLPEGPVEADADGARIGQVLGNLLANALKYSPPERPVRLALRPEGGLARVSVADQGPGIPPQELARVWEQFHRVESIPSQQGFGDGLGLGLYISRSIVERHGGEIGVESRVGEGSTFWFTLALSAPAG